MKDKILNLLVQYSIDVAKGDISPELFEDLSQEIVNTIEGDDKKYEYDRIIHYLNRVCKKNYRSSVTKTRQYIRGRYKEGFTTQDFFTVIDNMNYWWKEEVVVQNGRTYKMDEYLRPQTLFGTKFERYLLKTIPKTTCKPAEIE